MTAPTPYTVARDHLRAFRLYARTRATPYGELADLRLLEFAIRRMRAQHVVALRADGASWREVGELLGLTESQARHRYGGLDSTPAPKQNRITS